MGWHDKNSFNRCGILLDSETMMKFAIPAETNEGLNAKLPRYFSQARFFIIVEVNGQSVGKLATIENKLPSGVKDVTGATSFLLSGKGADGAIVSQIAEKDRLSLVGNNIRVFIGASGTVAEALKQYTGGKLTESSSCKKDPDMCDCC